jgi:hypothetical protein
VVWINLARLSIFHVLRENVNLEGLERRVGRDRLPWHIVTRAHIIADICSRVMVERYSDVICWAFQVCWLI